MDTETSKLEVVNTMKSELFFSRQVPDLDTDSGQNLSLWDDRVSG